MSTKEQWRVIQVFLPASIKVGSIAETEWEPTTKELRCTCAVFKKSGKTCKHTRFVMGRITSNNGVYQLTVDEGVTDADKEQAEKSPAAFREFVLKHGKVEVL